MCPSLCRAATKRLAHENRWFLGRGCRRISLGRLQQLLPPPLHGMGGRLYPARACAQDHRWRGGGLGAEGVLKVVMGLTTEWSMIWSTRRPTTRHRRHSLRRTSEGLDWFLVHIDGSRGKNKHAGCGGCVVVEGERKRDLGGVGARAGGAGFNSKHCCSRSDHRGGGGGSLVSVALSLTTG